MFTKRYYFTLLFFIAIIIVFQCNLTLVLSFVETSPAVFDHHHHDSHKHHHHDHHHKHNDHKHNDHKHNDHHHKNDHHKNNTTIPPTPPPPPPSPSPTPLPKVIIYDDKLSDRFFITSSPPLNVQSKPPPPPPPTSPPQVANNNTDKNQPTTTTKPPPPPPPPTPQPQQHKGNYSIEFVNSFYVFSKNDPNKNFTFDRTTYHYLSFDVMTTSPDQDITVTLISTIKDGYSLPLIDPIHPSNSFSKSASLLPHTWINIKVDLEYFPFNTFRGVWFLQKHPNTSIFIDNIILEPQKHLRNYERIYNDGMVGYGILIHDNSQTKLFQTKETYKNHQHSIKMDISKNNSLLFQYTSFLKPRNMSLSFLINWGGVQESSDKNDNDDVNNNHNHHNNSKLLESIDANESIQQVEDTNKKKKDHDNHKDDTKKGDNDEDHKKKNKDGSDGGDNDKDDHHDDNNDGIMIDSITLSFIPSLQIEQTRKYTFSRNKQRGWNRLTVKIPESTFSGFTFSHFSSLTEKYLIYFDDVRIEYLIPSSTPPLSASSISTKVLSDNNYEEKIVLATDYQNLYYQMDPSINGTTTPIAPTVSRYFPFTKVKLNYITSTNGAVSEWADGLPTVTLKTTQSKVTATGEFVEFDDPQLRSLLGPGRLEVLYQRETEMNEFQFLHIDFSYPTNRFYLVVGAVDNFEDIWISSTDSKSRSIAQWDLIASGFLTNDTSDTNNIKYKVKNQSLYLSASKGDDTLPAGTHRNYIVVQPVENISTLSFSMVSSVDSSRVFYSLYAIPRLSTTTAPATIATTTISTNNTTNINGSIPTSAAGLIEK